MVPPRLLLLGALLLAGCVTPPAATIEGAATTGEDAAAASRTSLKVPIKLTGCDHADLYVPVPASAVAPFVPEDFDVATAGVGPGGGPLALMFVGALRCDLFEAEGTSGRGDFGWTDVAVVPRSPALRREGANIHLLRLEHYALPGAMEEVQTRLGDRHMVATSVDISLGPVRPGVALAAGELSLRADAVASGAAPAGAFRGLVLREFGLAEGGYTFIDLTVAPARDTLSFVPGTLEASGGVAKDTMGARAAGTLVTARFDFADGQMGFLPKP